MYNKNLEIVRQMKQFFFFFIFGVGFHPRADENDSSPTCDNENEQESLKEIHKSIVLIFYV